MRMLNRLLEDASDAQSLMNRMLEPAQPVRRANIVAKGSSGENRQQRRARERAEKKAAARARKVAA